MHISEGHIINGVLNGIGYYSKLKEKLDHNYFDCNPNIVNIIKLYQEGKSPREIKEITKVNKITKILRENNISLRTRSESRKLYRKRR